MRSARILRAGAVLAVVAVPCACPVPVPSGYEASSRENVPAEPMDWITPGVTTREDVLMQLGEADAAAADSSWLAFGSAYSEGGVVFVIAAGGGAAGAGSEHMEYRRLLVRFDDAGRVASVDLVTRGCRESIVAMGNAGGRDTPCLDIRARE